jgi:hypothetical protein
MPADVSDEQVDASPEVDTVDAMPEPEAVAPAESSAEQAPAESPSPWDSLRQLPVFEGKSEAEIAAGIQQTLQREQALQHQLRQYQSILPVASDYLSNRELYERWKAGQQAAPQQAAAPQPTAEQQGWWNPPKIRDAYRQYLVKDENGREVIAPDAPLDARHALAEYQAYRAEFAKKFLENPEETLAPMVAKVAEQRAQELIQQQLARRDEEHFVSQVEQENADWLRDENGNVSREAVLAQKFVEDAKRFGIQGARPRWEYAKAMVERELLLGFYQQATAGTTSQQPAPQQPNPGEAAARQNMEFLRQQALRTPPRSSPGTTDPRVPPPRTTFEDKFRSQLAHEGLI